MALPAAAAAASNKVVLLAEAWGCQQPGTLANHAIRHSTDNV